MRAPESTIQRGFASGELAPVLHARADHDKYASGLRTCRNFMVLRHGAVANRPGFRFCGEMKDLSDSNVRLRRFVNEEGQGFIVELGDSYMRFWKNGGRITVTPDPWDIGTAYVEGDTVSNGGTNYYCILANTGNAPPNATYWYALTGDIYEVPTTYTTGGLIGGWEQSGNVVVITHRLHDPRELVYYNDTRWVLRLADTEPGIGPPQNLVLTPGAGALTYSYVVTARAENTYEESLPSAASTSAVMATPTAAAPHVLNWDDLTGAVEYNVYCDPAGNGVYGYIGTAAASNFNNQGVTPDFNVTPPLDRTPFVSAETRPHVATHYQQRRFYAQSATNPDGVEASRTGFINNFGISSPLQDDDALSFRMVGRGFHTVRHMLGLKRLIVMTDAGAWLVGQEQQPLTPFNLAADQHTYNGFAPDVPPVVIGESVIYLQKSASIVRDLRFDQDVEGMAGRDLTLFATHLFDGHTIDGMDYAETPHSIVWAVRDDGVLLGLTYVRDQDIWGWHRHDTQGNFEQICTTPEAEGDVLYAVVRRTIDSNTVRYLERLESREIVDFDEDVFFVDSGLSYSGAPADTFTGLDHLEGEQVAVVADGAVISDGDPDSDYPAFVVTAGTVTLPAEYSEVHIGLRIVRAQIETLDLDAPGTAVRDKQKRVGSMTLLVDKSSRSFYAGPDEDNVSPYELGLLEAAGDEFTGQLEIALEASFEKPGRVLVWQTDPLPLTVLGIMPNTIVGG